MKGTGSPQRINPLLLFPGIGNRTIRLVNNLGAMAIFFSLAFINIFRRRQFREIVNQVYYIGATSSLIVMLVGLFTGMVLGLQLFYTLVKFGSVGALGTAVSLSLIREMGPVLTAIMITARAGSGIAAEVGILRMSEQVDALYTMGVDPVRYLISPRIAASIISFPLLTAFFDLIGIIGGYITGVLLLGTHEGTYFYRVQSSIDMVDVRGGFIKALVFAVIVSYRLLLPGLFLPYAARWLWIKGSRSCHGLGRRAFLCDDSRCGLCGNFLYYVGLIMETTPLIEFKNVSKQFGDKIVLNKVNLTVYEDQITTIIGKSGTGKSVLLKHIVGLLKPDGGTILFEGKPVGAMKKSEWQAYRSRIAYLFQNNALLDSMTVFDNVAFPLRQTTNLSKVEIEKRVLKRIEDLELTEAVDDYPSELSGGMQKRVALARALVTDPKIVLFDEPTTGQDPIRKNMILSMISPLPEKVRVYRRHDQP